MSEISQMIPVKYAIESLPAFTGLIKGKAASEPAPDLVPAFSASGQDVWIPKGLARASGTGLVLSSVGARCGKVFLADFDLWGTVANTDSFRPREGWDGRFLWYSLNQEGFWEKGGAAQPYVKVPESLTKSVLRVGLETQRTIADYLDRETGEIDAMLGRLEELAEVLEVRRDIVWANSFNEALDAGQPVKLRMVIASIVDGPFGSSLTSAHYADEGARVIRLGNIGINGFRDEDKAYIPLDYSKKLDAHAVLPGDVVIAGLGDERMPLGRATVVPNIGPAIVKADCYRVRPSDRVSSRYLAWALSAPQARSQFRFLSRGTTRARLNTNVVQQVEIPLISLEQQQQLLKHHMDVTGKIDAMLAKVAELKELLTERRAALIADVVTGRKDITNA